MKTNIFHQKRKMMMKKIIQNKNNNNMVLYNSCEEIVFWYRVGDKSAKGHFGRLW